MRRSSTGALILCATVLHLAGCARPPGAPPIAVTTAIPDVRLWESAPQQDPATQFRRLVMERHAVVYGRVLSPRTDSQLVGYLAWLSPRLPAAYRVASHVDTLIAPVARRVAAVFPSLARDTLRIFIGPSLGATNGTVRLVDGRPLLIVGVDVQTIVSDSAGPARALLAHESVHVAHAIANPAVYAFVEAGVRGTPTPLYASLFSEGLATWGSMRVDPAVTTEQALMSTTLDAEGRARCAELMPRLRAELESTDSRRYSDWFFLSGRDATIPRRFAYFAGARIVARMAESRSPEALLRLSAPEILAAMRVALDDATVCG